MDCPELKALLDRLESDSIPRELRPVLEAHLEECRNCRAAMNNYLKIGKILEKTVYGDTLPDHCLNFLRQVSGRKLRWETAAETLQRQKKVPWLLILRVAAGFAVAIGLGISAAVILGHFGLIGRGPAGDKAKVPAEISGPLTPLLESAPPSTAESAASLLEESRPDSQSPVLPPGSPVSPDAVYGLLNPESRPADFSGPVQAAAPDSSRLKGMEAELEALRDALSRTPDDGGLRQRMMDKYREVIDERKNLGRAAQVRDYYNLGYLHYTAGQYPQTAIVTGEGLRMVRIGPTEYLHYLKGLSHYQIALKSLNPLPPDSTLDEQARLKGATLRAELDAEGRKRAVIELRRSIAEFSHLLKIPALESAARDWIIKCDNLIRQSAAES